MASSISSSIVFFSSGGKHGVTFKPPIRQVVTIKPPIRLFNHGVTFKPYFQAIQPAAAFGFGSEEPAGPMEAEEKKPPAGSEEEETESHEKENKKERKWEKKLPAVSKEGREADEKEKENKEERKWEKTLEIAANLVTVIGGIIFFISSGGKHGVTFNPPIRPFNHGVTFKPYFQAIKPTAAFGFGSEEPAGPMEAEEKKPPAGSEEEETESDEKKNKKERKWEKKLPVVSEEGREGD